MAVKKTAPVEAVLYSGDVAVARPRLHKLIIRNFCAIGATPVEIELDDIVVLVGPNNAGKSSILRAYEVVMNHGSKEGHLAIEDFPGGVVDDNALPEIELQTVVYDNSPGPEWILEDAATKERFVRERWRWPGPGGPVRQGFDVEADGWSDKVPWGAPNVAKSRRPQPHRVDAFASPEKQAAEIIKLLTAILEQRVKAHRTTSDGEDTAYAKLLKSIGALQSQIVEEAQAELKAIQDQLSTSVAEVFPGYAVMFDAKPEEDLDKCLALFKGAPQLTMGPTDGHMSSVARQGSGARRTLLWTALRIIKEVEAAKGGKAGETRPHVLLLDEPELCLHPNAIREARRVLYSLPASGNWQVMLTTHSPVFIDLSRDNTTVVRVERRPGDGAVTGSTLFRPLRARLDDDDRARLKLLNLCDPYVNEFFFGGKIVVVEGDTEYTAFRHIAEQVGDEFRDLQVIRARGKATIRSLVKILNHFGVEYAVLHDSDRPTYMSKGVEKKNPAWTANEQIRKAVLDAPDPTKVHQVASLPNFEAAFLGEEVDGNKPYNALSTMKAEVVTFARLLALLRCLTNPLAPAPEGAIRWTTMPDLEKALNVGMGGAVV